MALNLKPRLPVTYDGKRDQITVNAWIYIVEIYFSLIEVGDQNVIAKSDKIIYAAAIFSGSEASWWFQTIKRNRFTVSWYDFFMRCEQSLYPLTIRLLYKSSEDL